MYRGARGDPPSPCWTCELLDGADANHPGDECPVVAERLKNKQCTLCGSPDHRKTACDKFFADKHVANHPKVTYFPMGPRQASITWCLRCGAKAAHATADSTEESPPILFPMGSDKQQLEGIYTWCGIRGHTYQSCMHRAPQQADANKAAIDDLSYRVDALSKSVEVVSTLDSKVTTLQQDMKGLMQWKTGQSFSHSKLQAQVQGME